MTPRSGLAPRMKALDKVKTISEMAEICRSLRLEERRIVFTNGCFDLLHVGHVRYLEYAAEQGDILIVGVNTDSSVRRIKGPLRPITSEQERSELVAALHCVDYAVLFDTPDPLPLIVSFQPDVLVKGADWPLDKIIGADEVRKEGGEVVRAPVIPRASTTGIIEEIVRRYDEEASGG